MALNIGIRLAKLISKLITALIPANLKYPPQVIGFCVHLTFFAFIIILLFKYVF